MPYVPISAVFFCYMSITKLYAVFISGPTASRGEPYTVRSQLTVQNHWGGNVRHLWKIRSHQTDQSVSSIRVPYYFTSVVLTDWYM